MPLGLEKNRGNEKTSQRDNAVTTTEFGKRKSKRRSMNFVIIFSVIS